jgi:hypothetical protein
VAVAAAVKVARAEAIAAAARQQRKPHPSELREERRKVREDQGSEACGCSGQRDRRGGGRQCGATSGRGSDAAADEGLDRGIQPRDRR